jgi:hypothetical protein
MSKAPKSYFSKHFRRVLASEAHIALLSVYHQQDLQDASMAQTTSRPINAVSGN